MIDNVINEKGQIKNNLRITSNDVDKIRKGTYR